MLKKNNLKQQGFTIVELLIVIVIIGILAAITIVAYNGIQNRAKLSSYQSDTASIVKKLEAYNAIQSTYPLTAAGADAATVTTQTAAGTALTTLVNSLNDSKMSSGVSFFGVVPIATVPTNAQTTTAVNANGAVNSYFVAWCATGKGIRVYYPDPTSTGTVAKFIDAGVCP